MQSNKMARVPKHRRIKRATVLIKRTRCIRNTKTKSFSPLYQKLKVNNHSLARALSQEKQESQLLFTRNIELLAEVQDLVHACNNRDLVITNVLKNAKDMMQMLVTMSGFLTNTISACQEFVSNQVNIHRTSTSSAGRRESSRRLSTKSPARGVVKPMVSGHTITKPTINLSRVNMQRLQNVNLSIIEEGPSTPERTLDRSVESRHSRIMPERLPLSSLRNEDDADRVIVNRRTNRFSGGRLSGRYSKRNSGRLSGGGVVVGRLSKRSSEYSELLKSPRVTLQDVSRYLINNQSVNIKMLSEGASSSQLSDSTIIDDTRPEEEDSRSSERREHEAEQPDSQEFSETSESEEAASPSAKPSSHKRSKRRSSAVESAYVDPLEGSSWMHNSSIISEDEQEADNAGLASANRLRSESDNSPLNASSSLQHRRTSNYFRVPNLPKAFAKSADTSHEFLDNDDEEDQQVKLCYITQRRGASSKVFSINGNRVDDDLDDDDMDDETLMLNMRRHLNEVPAQQTEQPERLQFDVNELLQLTPLKPLLSMSNRVKNGTAQVDLELEPTATIQITQRCPKPVETTETFSQMSNVKIQQNDPPELPTVVSSRNQEPDNIGQEKQSELTGTRLNSKIGLPRLTDILNASENNEQQLLTDTTPQKSKPKRKRVVKNRVPIYYSPSDNSEEETFILNKNKKQRKKKTNDKDPSTAKVVLQKLHDTHQVSPHGDDTNSERKNSDESVASAKSSLLARINESNCLETSTASLNNKPSTRPRRLKAPTNLQEPTLNKKLRR